MLKTFHFPTQASKRQEKNEFEITSNINLSQKKKISQLSQSVNGKFSRWFIIQPKRRMFIKTWRKTSIAFVSSSYQKRTPQTLGEIMFETLNCMNQNFTIEIIGKRYPLQRKKPETHFPSLSIYCCCYSLFFLSFPLEKIL